MQSQGVLKAGDRLGRFELRAELGRGSHGAVFEAVDVLLGEKVAVKALQPWLAGDPTLRERFKRELVLTRRVSHPGVARLHDLHEEDGVLFISMQFIEGRSLSQAIRAGIGSEDRVIRVLRGVCSALAAAHAEGVIHRDLKPANIMLADAGDRGERVVVLDFGIATATGVGQLTRPGEAMGSVPYVPPEVWAGQSATPKGDQYSLAITAFVCLTKELPYTGRTPLEVLDAIKAKSPTIRERNADVDLELEAVILKAMAKDPEQRFANVADFELALRRVAERRASGGPPPTTPEAARALVSPQVAPPPVDLAPRATTGPDLVLTSSLEAELAGPSAARVASRSMRRSPGTDSGSAPASPAPTPWAPDVAPPHVDAPTGGHSEPLTVESAAIMLMPETQETGEVKTPFSWSKAPALGGDAAAAPADVSAPAAPPSASPDDAAGPGKAEGFEPAPTTSPVNRSRDTLEASEDPPSFIEATVLVPRRRVHDDEATVAAPAPEELPPTRSKTPIAAITVLAGVVIVLAIVALRQPTEPAVALAPPAPPVDLPTDPTDPAATDPPGDPPPADPPPADPPADPQPVDPPADPPPDPAADPAVDPATPDEPERDSTRSRRFTAALDAVAQAATKRGLRNGDVPALDTALASGRRAAKAGDKGGVENATKTAKAALDGATVDKAFVSAKLARFNKAFDTVNDQKAKDALRPIAKDVMVRISKGAWVDANQRLNDGFLVLAKAKR